MYMFGFAAGLGLRIGFALGVEHNVGTHTPGDQNIKTAVCMVPFPT